jgi:sulfofructose kinase
MQEKFSQIIGIGVCCLDRLGLAKKWPNPDEGTHLLDFSRQCGGMVATALAAATRLGMPTALISMAGRDESGRFLKKQMDRLGVNTTGFLLRKNFPTPVSNIIVQQKNGARRIFHYRQREYDLQPEEVDFSPVTRAAYLHLDGHLMDVALEAARLAKNHKVRIGLDAWRVYPRIGELLPFVDDLISNRSFAEKFTGEQNIKKALTILSEEYKCRIVAATLGDKGGIYYFRKQFTEFPAYPVSVVDTTGAGDVFHGAWMAAQCRNYPVRKSFLYASAAAALSCRALGGQAALPTHEEVIQLMKN